MQIRLTPTGKAVFSHASKAFVLWRQHTPPWIPDEAFASHYVTIEQYDCVFALLEQKKELESLASETLRLGDLVLVGIEPLEDWLRNFANWSKKNDEGYDSSKFVTLVGRDAQVFVICFPTSWSHADVAGKILKLNPTLRLSGGDSIDVWLRWDSQCSTIESLRLSLKGERMWVAGQREEVTYDQLRTKFLETSHRTLSDFLSSIEAVRF